MGPGFIHAEAVDEGWASSVEHGPRWEAQAGRGTELTGACALVLLRICHNSATSAASWTGGGTGEGREVGSRTPSVQLCWHQGSGPLWF